MRRRLLILASIAGVTLFALLSRPYLYGLAFVVRAAHLEGPVGRLAALGAHDVRQEDIEIAATGRALLARVYAPTEAFERTLVLVPGLHAAGIDEPVVSGLARDLAASGIAVITPEIPQLSELVLTPAIVDTIEEIALWVSRQEALAPDGRVGLAGAHLSGGLVVVAAGRPGLQNRIAYVLSLGGYESLPRVLKYLCAGSPGEPTPHDSGVALILLGLADRLVPAGQVMPLREAVRRFLQASHLARRDTAAAEAEFAALRMQAATLPLPSATLLTYVNNRDIARLGMRLLPYLGVYGDAPELSPQSSATPTAPVLLLHDTDDNLVPASESLRLADHLRGRTPVRLLLSGQVVPTETEHAGPLDLLTLAGFWGDLLAR